MFKTERWAKQGCFDPANHKKRTGSPKDFITENALKSNDFKAFSVIGHLPGHCQIPPRDSQHKSPLWKRLFIKHIVVQAIKRLLDTGEGRGHVHSDVAGAVKGPAVLPAHAHVPAGLNHLIQRPSGALAVVGQV